MATRVTPTFLLKGVDPNKLLADYQAGVFTRQPLIKSKIKIANNTAILAPIYGTSNYESIYRVKDRHNCDTVIATNGHSNFEVFTRTGGQLQVGGRCDLCKKDFDHVAIGYPVGYQELTVLTNNTPDPKTAVYRIIYTFWVEKEFCRFECAAGYVQLLLSRPCDFRDTTVRDSYRMLQMLYKLMHPDAGPLRPAQDPSLLIKDGRGGSLTEEQYNDRRHIYVRTDRILMIPAKVEYVQQNFLNPATSIDLIREASTVAAPSSQ